MYTVNSGGYNGSIFADYSYNGPSRAVAAVANAVMSQGIILPIAVSPPNASWELEFSGPSVDCQDIEDAKRLEIQQNAIDYFNYDVHYNRYCTPYVYMAWYPRYVWNRHRNRTTSGLPFSQGSSKTSEFNFDTGMLVPLSELSYPIPTPDQYDATMYLVAWPNAGAWCGNANRISQSELFEGIMLQCRLRNSTYHVSFNYTDGVQEIAIKLQDRSSDRPVGLISEVVGPLPEGPVKTCALLLDDQTISSKLCPVDIDLLQTLSYQAIFDAFTSNIVGGIVMQFGQFAPGKAEILNTALADLEDLQYLHSIIYERPPLQDVLNNTWNGSFPIGLTTDRSKISRQPLGSAIEEMFQNLTVSLMSSSALQ